MGMIEDYYRRFTAYKEANTPRTSASQPQNSKPQSEMTKRLLADIAMREKAQQESGTLFGGLRNAARVFNEGMINPNQYNAPSANRFKDSALGMAGIVPGLGDYASGAQAADYWNRGEKGNALLAGLGALPLVPAIGGMFIGKNAKTWDVLKAQQAEELLAKGVDPREVWKQTGTMRGVDNALRQEIPDNAARMTGHKFSMLPRKQKREFMDIKENYDAYGANGISEKQQKRLNFLAKKLQVSEPKFGQIVEHDALFDAYPNLANVKIQPTEASNLSYRKGVINTPENGYYRPSEYMHEMQHAIQDTENFAKGGAVGTLGVKDFYDYSRLAGEAEARLTQSRMRMTMPERLQSYPYDMLDVPQDQLIVRGLLDGPAMSVADEAAQKASNHNAIGLNGQPIDPRGKVRKQ